MNVLSLFDGMSCGQLALQKAKIPYDYYFASEIDKSAIELTKHNFPKTMQLGDVKNYHGWELPKIDLLIGGSPCQGFSINGGRLNFDDPRSKLLFTYIRIRNKLRPKYWLLENVATMADCVKQRIDELMGTDGVLINSNTVSAQNRKRYYWANFKLPALHEPSGMVIKDILETDIAHNYFADSFMSKQRIEATETDGVITINPKRFDNRQTYQQDRIYDCNGRMVALTSTLGDRFRIKDGTGKCRKLTVREQARLQCIPDWYSFDKVSNARASHCIGNAFTVDVVAKILEQVKEELI